LFLWTWGAFRILAYPSDYWTLHPGAASQLFCLDSIPLERPAFVDWTWYPQASLSLGTWHTKRPGYCCCLQLPDPKWSRVQDLAVQNSTTDSGRRIGLTSSTCCRGLPRSTRARHATELSSRARFSSQQRHMDEFCVEGLFPAVTSTLYEELASSFVSAWQVPIAL